MQKPIVCTPRNKHTCNTDYTMQHKYVYELYHSLWVTWRLFWIERRIMMANIKKKMTRDFWCDRQCIETKFFCICHHMTNLLRWLFALKFPPINMNFHHVISNLNSAAFWKCAIRTFWNFHFLNILVVRFPGSIFTFVSNGFTDGTFTNVVQLLSNSITSCLSMP